MFLGLLVGYVVFVGLVTWLLSVRGCFGFAVCCNLLLVC